MNLAHLTGSPLLVIIFAALALGFAVGYWAGWSFGFGTGKLLGWNNCKRHFSQERDR